MKEGGLLMANREHEIVEEEDDDDNDHDAALSVRRVPASQRRAAELAEMGVNVPLPRGSERAILGGNGRSGKNDSKIKAARQRRRRLS